jgi:carboxymethylenebutenolidase
LDHELTIPFHSATDVFGVAIPNPKLIADILATSTGLVVYVPDFLEGE